MKRFSGVAVVLGLLGVLTALLLWRLPADDFLFVPHEAQPLAGKVVISEQETVATAGEDSIYYVDLFVRRISLLEELVPFTRPDGSTVEPEEQVAPAGESDEERRIQNAADMRRSEEIAAFVALHALGYEPTATPRGVIVAFVDSDAPAAAKLASSDVIVAVDGTPVRTPSHLREQIGRHEPGDQVRLTVRRGEQTIDVQVRTVQSADGGPRRTVIGVIPEQDVKITLPFEVDIDLGSVGGPSAGLPFALEIARQLGRDVTKGCRIASTGALALDGTVIPIGGVKQKTIGAERADVDYFLVPAGENAADAQQEADDVEIIPVDSFQQALQKLATTVEKC